MFTPSSTPATHQSTSITQPPDQTDTSSIEYIPSYGNSIRGRGHSSASNQSNDDIESNLNQSTPRQRLQSQDVDDLKMKYQFRKTKQSSIFSTCFGNMKRTLISLLILIFILSSLYFVVLQRRRVSNSPINSPTNVGGNTHNVVKSQLINENVKTRNEILAVDQKEKKNGILQVKKKKTKKEDDELIDEKSLDELLREDKKPKKEKKEKKIKPKKKIPQIVKKKQVVYQGQEKKAKHDEVIEKYLKLIDEKKPKKKKPTLDEDLKNHPLLQLDPEPFIPKKKVEQPKEKPLEKKKEQQPVTVEIPKKEEKKQEKNEPVFAAVEKEIKNPNTDAAVPVEDKKESKEEQIAKEQPKQAEIPKVETPKVEEKKTETKVEDESVKDVKPESVEEEEVHQNPKIETPTKPLEKTKEPAKIETPKKKKPIEKKREIKKKLPKKKKEIKKKPAKKEKQPKKELDDATLLATHPLFQDNPHPFETPKDEPKKDQAKEAEKKPEEPKKDKKRVNKYPVKANKKPKKAIIKKKAIKKPAKKVIKKPKIVKPKKAAGKKKDEATEQDFSKHPLFQEEPHTFTPPTKEDATVATPEKKGPPPQLPSDLTDANIKEYLSAYRAYHGSLEGIEKGMDKKQAKKIVSFIEKEYSK